MGSSEVREPGAERGRRGGVEREGGGRGRRKSSLLSARRPKPPVLIPHPQTHKHAHFNTWRRLLLHQPPAPPQNVFKDVVALHRCTEVLVEVLKLRLGDKAAAFCLAPLIDQVLERLLL